LLWFQDTAAWDEIHGFYSLSICDRSVQTKEQAITAILDRLVEAGALEAELRQGVLTAILKREACGSTGIGRGVAIPHVMYPSIDRVIGAIARFYAGVEFNSLDGRPVHLVFLIVSPWDRPGEHLRMLEAIARRLRDAG
jgi:PTS system fructose-specific IIA component/PTS system nitrogen regulatory IIA component